MQLLQSCCTHRLANRKITTPQNSFVISSLTLMSRVYETVGNREMWNFTQFDLIQAAASSASAADISRFTQHRQRGDSIYSCHRLTGTVLTAQRAIDWHYHKWQSWQDLHWYCSVSTWFEHYYRHLRYTLCLNKQDRPNLSLSRT